jgi:hypothetical protein
MNTGEIAINQLTFVASARLMAAIEKVAAKNANISSNQNARSHFFENQFRIATLLF